jgi:hypothetical protein
MKKFLVAAALAALVMVAAPEAEAHPPACPPYTQPYTVWNGFFYMTLCVDAPRTWSSHYYHRHHRPKARVYRHHRPHAHKHHQRQRYHRRHRR